MKNILITGAAGFIGTNYVKKIAVKEKDYHFVLLDALTYAGHYENIKVDVESNSHLEFVHGNIVDEKLMDELFKKYQFSGVINYAAESHVDRSITNPQVFVQTNVNGTLNLLHHSLKAFENNPNFRYLQVSTDEVYGSLTEEDPAFTENHPLAANSPYSASKAAADLLVRSYYETYQLPTLITRCSNNYGPYQMPEKLIPLMITKARADQKLPVYGNGKNIRDWIYVDDHNRGVWQTFLQGRIGEIYNFGGQAEKRNLEIVELILAQLNKPKELIEFVTDRKGHDWRYAMNIEKVHQEFNWKPQVSFDQGMQLTLDWYLQN